MTSMTSPTTRIVIGGVDTHGHTHHAAVIDNIGRQLGDREFTATPAGYRALAAWLGQHGTLEMIGVEGTGFLWNMVRIIAGTLLEVGLGRHAPESIDAMLAARDRRSSGGTAPAQGLYLQWIRFKAENA